MSIVIACITALSGFAGVCIGGLLTHRLALKREGLSEQRALRTELSLRTAKSLVAALSNPEPDDSVWEALNDILMIGTDDEVQAVLEFFAERKRTGSMDLSPVLELVRANLRESLQLSPSPLPAGAQLVVPERRTRSES
ncbi:hypothetical protein [Gordonia sp. NB41Y]|uniref:hypothetical protein n=1 Tax=Gordonia sp. NB41Y TaxID=875808 RepID=UPI00034AE786|nr:hypothetical protein [Gordonia sp. NB41Y]WLP90580.1 hypothetical protein Q9K23_24335 [Gordonia sp. NB41Y]